MRGLTQLEQQGAALCERLSAPSTYLEVVAGIFDLLGSIQGLEVDGVDRAAIVEALAAPRQMVRRSPLFARLQDWPRGYAGDFETIEYVLRARNLAEWATVAFHLEQYGLASPAAQQHRNKVRRQGELILDLCGREAPDSKPTARILSLACGSSPDLASVQHRVRPDAQFTLFDSDADALRYSRDRLKGVGSQCRFVEGNVLRLGQSLSGHGHFDLVLIGGLFDYLRGRTIVRVLKLLWSEVLAPGGKLFFTNISADNPDRIWIEYLADWVLIARDEASIIGLCRDADIDERHCKLERDATGSAILVELSR
jgi:extracellular factor (EF) 3-hydroxypalmitic acid methyl ester biosynthesis protein